MCFFCCILFEEIDLKRIQTTIKKKQNQVGCKSVVRNINKKTDTKKQLKKHQLDSRIQQGKADIIVLKMTSKSATENLITFLLKRLLGNSESIYNHETYSYLHSFLFVLDTKS